MRLFALAALLAATPAFAQDAVVLAPGHPDLSTADLTYQSRTMDVALVQPMAAELGTLTETVVHHDDGTVSVTFAVDIELPGGNGGQTTRNEGRFAWPSLAPIAYASWDLSDGDAGEVAFDGRHVTGTYGEDGAEPLPFDLTLDADVFGPGTAGILARAIPLDVGYRATAPVFSPEDRLEEMALAVTGREAVETADGTVEAVVVELSGTGPVQRYLVHPETRDLLKMTVAPGPGALIVATPR